MLLRPMLAGFSLSLLSMCLTPSIAPAVAADNPPEDRGTSEGDEYDFSWMDPDKKVYVVQNRKYRKAMRPAVYLGGGLNLSNPFRSGYGGVGRGGFYISEQLGFEGFFGYFSNGDTSTLTALKNRTSVLPFVREIRSYYGGNVAWSPFYAKINVFNKIIYFDWFFNAGVGGVNTANDRNTVSGAASNFVEESHLGLFFGTGLNVFPTRNFLVRLETIGVNYGATGADDTERRFTNFDFVLGAGYLF